MNTLSILSTAATLVELVLESLKSNSTGVEVAADVIKSLQAALAELSKVQGSPVVASQFVKLPEHF